VVGYERGRRRESQPWRNASLDYTPSIPSCRVLAGQAAGLLKQGHRERRRSASRLCAGDRFPSVISPRLLGTGGTGRTGTLLFSGLAGEAAREARHAMTRYTCLSLSSCHPAAAGEAGGILRPGYLGRRRAADRDRCVLAIQGRQYAWPGARQRMGRRKCASFMGHAQDKACNGKERLFGGAREWVPKRGFADGWLRSVKEQPCARAARVYGPGEPP
jgi:hypothetical protein